MDAVEGEFVGRRRCWTYVKALMAFGGRSKSSGRPERKEGNGVTFK